MTDKARSCPIHLASIAPERAHYAQKTQMLLEETLRKRFWQMLRKHSQALLQRLRKHEICCGWILEIQHTGGARSTRADNKNPSLALSGTTDALAHFHFVLPCAVRHTSTFPVSDSDHMTLRLKTKDGSSKFPARLRSGRFNLLRRP